MLLLIVPCCSLEDKFNLKELSLVDSNEKFSVEFKDKQIIICAKDYSSLRAGVNAIIKELAIIEKVEELE